MKLEEHAWALVRPNGNIAVFGGELCIYNYERTAVADLQLMQRLDEKPIPKVVRIKLVQDDE